LILRREDKKRRRGEMRGDGTGTGTWMEMEEGGEQGDVEGGEGVEEMGMGDVGDCDEN
jgi:hypothetical protein